MSEYIYTSNGEPLANERGEILLARAGEIVRCRDCTYYDDEPDLVSSTPKCWLDPEKRGTARWTRPDGFCSWAERREP